MKLIKCEKCGYEIPTVMNVNCRVMHCTKIEDENTVDMDCILGIYCPTCGTESTFGIKRCFTKEFSKMPEQYLRDIALCESGVI